MGREVRVAVALVGYEPGREDGGDGARSQAGGGAKPLFALVMENGVISSSSSSELSALPSGVKDGSRRKNDRLGDRVESVARGTGIGAPRFRTQLPFSFVGCIVRP